MLASFLETGSISWLYYSDRLVEFPLGILGVGLATVILPRLSRHQAEQSAAKFSQSLDWGLRMTLIFGIPAAVGLVALAGPMIATLFESDVFGAHDVSMAERSLMAYAVGALATSLSAYVNAYLLFRSLRRDEAYQPYAGWTALFVKVGVAATAMALVLWWVSPSLADWIGAPRSLRAGWLAGLVAVGGVVYLGVLLLFGMRVRDLRAGNIGGRR